MQALFIGGKVTLSLIILLYASWKDYKTREVTNKVWVVYAPIALILSLTEFLLFDSAKLPLYGISFGITSVFALLLFYSGGFGGADSKALMCIALALPFSTEMLFTPILASGVSPLAQILFPLTIFSNSVLFAAASGIYMLSRNFISRIQTGKELFEGTLATEPITKKLIVLITGYKVSIANLKKKWHIYPMEDLSDYDDSQLNRKLIVIPKDEGRDEIVNRLYKAATMGKIGNYVWATPGLPMLIFVTIGLIFSVLFGDFIWIIISYILG